MFPPTMLLAWYMLMNSCITSFPLWTPKMSRIHCRTIKKEMMSMDNSLYIQRYNSCLEVLLSDLPKFFVSQWLTVSMIIQNIVYGKFGNLICYHRRVSFNLIRLTAESSSKNYPSMKVFTKTFKSWLTGWF